MHNLDKYERDLDEEAKEKEKEKHALRNKYDDPFGYEEEGFIDGDKFSEIVKDNLEEMRNKKLKDETGDNMLKEIGDTISGYFAPSNKKTAKLHTINAIMIRKKTELDLQIFFKLLNRSSVEGLAYLFIKQKGRTAYIYDMMVPEQSVSGSNCDPNPSALARWMIKNRNNPKKEDLKGWAHSHCNMSCFWSTTDDEYAKSLTNGIDLTKPKMLFSMVYSFNGKEKRKACFKEQV